MQGVHGAAYLFGTVHVMRKEVIWQTPKVKSAFNSSNNLYLEIADISDESIKAMQPQIMQLGVDPQHPLSTKISKEDVAILDAAVKKMGAPGETSFEPMKPWLVNLTLSIMPAVQAGYDPGSGIDKSLSAEAKAHNKPIHGFETMDQQMHFFADSPDAEQAAMLHDTLVDLPKSVPEINDLVADWTNGDMDKISKLSNDEMKLKHPALYDKLLVQRNADFAGQIAKLLKDPAEGTSFIAIGAAHLAGPRQRAEDARKAGLPRHPRGVNLKPSVPAGIQ